MLSKRWSFADPCPPDFLTGRNVPFPLNQLLWQRGLRDLEAVEAFLHPSWEAHIHDPAQFRHMTDALACLFDALVRRERITVHGDYDADGVTGATVLISTLRMIEALMQPQGSESYVDFYIPHRDKEGYGLHANTVPKLVERGTRVIVTVDCGIACVQEIALAQATGIKTIVVDHHQFGETLPEGFLIHPGLPEETYPFKSLAAVGVSYKFACELLREARARGLDIPVGSEKWLLDLVAIATVTDMVPLIGENRVLQTYGLKVLNKTKRPGLQALIEAAGLTLGNLDTESVGFAIGPRINAAGRMDHASLALRLLLCESSDEARTLAKELERLNRLRQETMRVMMKEAQSMMVERGEAKAAIVLWQPHWSPALVGLVAGRFLDTYHRPILAIGSHDGQWIGSGRSIAGYDITAAVRECGEGILTRSGGHAPACGFALTDPDLLPLFAERLEAHAGARIDAEAMTPELKIDAQINLSMLNESLVVSLQRLEPFGEGNPRPIFAAMHVPVIRAQALGATNQHVRLTLLDDHGRRVDMFAFNAPEVWKEVPSGSFVNVAFHVSVNEWRGRRSVEGKLLDLQRVL